MAPTNVIGPPKVLVFAFGYRDYYQCSMIISAKYGYGVTFTMTSSRGPICQSVAAPE